MIVGILGGGQLGRMLALAGYPLGLQFRFLDHVTDAPAGQIAPLVIGEADDVRALDEFVGGLAVATYEFENVPLSAARFLGRRLAVHPSLLALEMAQDRLNEKEVFTRFSIPTAPFATVDSASDFEPALERCGVPAILKTRRFGYDGKGQARINSPADLPAAWADLGEVPCLLEGVVPFDREVSLLAVRSSHGDARFYPLVQNVHSGGILRESRAPAPGPLAELQSRAEQLVTPLLEWLDYVGVLAVEFFQVGETLVANEMAPRVHNSGHWTIEGAVTSQFENHLRAILGLPLGSTAARGPCAMLNLIGTLPERGPILEVPDTHLHFYGKEPRPGRKVGHVTVCADTPAELDERLARLRAACTS